MEFERLLIDKGYMECEHDWEKIDETDYEEMDYCSYGGGVDHFIVTTYRCRICGELKKESTGDCNGDPSEYLEITDKERKNARLAVADD